MRSTAKTRRVHPYATAFDNIGNKHRHTNQRSTPTGYSMRHIGNMCIAAVTQCRGVHGPSGLVSATNLHHKRNNQRHMRIQGDTAFMSIKCSSVRALCHEYGGPLGRFWYIFPPFFCQKSAVLLDCSFDAKERAMLGQLRAPQTWQQARKRTPANPHSHEHQVRAVTFEPKYVGFKKLKVYSWARPAATQQLENNLSS